MSDIQVVPCIKIVEKDIDRVLISIVAINLGVSCVVRAECKKGDGYPEMIQTYLLEGEEYSLWSSDDNYIINYVLDKLGLVKKPEEIAQSLESMEIVEGV